MTTCDYKFKFSEMVLKKMENKKYVQPREISDARKRTVDEIIFDSLTITFQSNDDIKLFLETVKNNNIYVKIYSQNLMLYCVDLNFLIEYASPYISENTISIKLHTNTSIYMCLLFHEDITIEFDEDNLINNIVESAVYVNNYRHDKPHGYYYYKSPSLDKYLYQSFSWLGGKINLNSLISNDYQFRINTYVNPTHIYILSSNVKNLTRFCVSLENQKKAVYDKYAIHTCFEKISDNLYAIPLSAKFLNETKTSDIGRIVRYIDIELEFSEKPIDLGIYIYNKFTILYPKQTYDDYDDDSRNCIITCGDECFLSPNLSGTGLNIFDIWNHDKMLYQSKEFYSRKSYGPPSFIFIGFWKRRGNHHVDEFIENSATENQDHYIKLLKEVQCHIEKNLKFCSSSAVFKLCDYTSSCNVCNYRSALSHPYGRQRYNYYCPKKKLSYQWPEKYVHELEAHNIKIDERMVQFLDDYVEYNKLNKKSWLPFL